VNIHRPQVIRPEFSPRSLVRALWKHKLSIAGLWLLGSVAIGAYVFSLRPIYSADAMVLVESQKIPENFVASTVQTVLEARMDMLKQQVLSKDRLWSLIETLNLYQERRRKLTREEVIAKMRSDISITLERGWSANRPGAFRISYQAFNPKIAADVTNRIGRFFINENLRQREAEAADTSEFLDSQLAESKSKLQEQEAKLRDFKVQYNGELPEQEGAMLAQMSQSKAELLGLLDAIGRAQQNKLILETSLAAAQAGANERRSQNRQRAARERIPATDSLPALTPAAPSGPPPPTRLERLRSELADLRLRYEDQHPEVQRKAAEIAQLEAEEAGTVRREVRSTGPTKAAAVRTPQDTYPTDPAVDEAASAEGSRIDLLKSQLNLAAREVETLEARRERIIQEVGEVQSHVQKLPLREQQLASITRDYETSRTNYHSLLDKKLAADMAENMERWQKAERFVMLDEARVPEKPIRPKRVILTAGGSVFSLLLAAALIFLLELKKDVLLGEWELPAGTVVLGRIPHIKLKIKAA
jgi:polysaccharide biosynthesis transport protein